MISSLLLSLREGLEAALIVGLVLGVLQKMAKGEFKIAVWMGVFCATLMSFLIAYGLRLIGLELEGIAEHIFEGSTMFLAALVLTWMIFWMNAQSNRLRLGMEAEVKQALASSGARAIFAIVFVAVLREGIELALFLTAASFSSNMQSLWLGSLLGLGITIVFGVILYKSTVHINIKRFFQITGLVLLLFSAGLVGHAVKEFIELGWIPPLINQVWNINSIINENSIFGGLLESLIGYNANPSLVEIMAYLVYLSGIGIVLYRKSLFSQRKRTEIHIE